MSSLSISSMSSSEDSPLISSITSKSKSKSQKKRSMRNRLFKKKAPRGYSALGSRVRPSAPPADLVFADQVMPSAPPADLVFGTKINSKPPKIPKKMCNLELNNKEERENLYFLVECLMNVFTKGPNDPIFKKEKGEICKIVNRAADKATNLNDPNLVAKIAVYLYTQGSKNIYEKLNESLRSIFQGKGKDDVQTMYEKWREYIISILKAAQPRKQEDTTRFTLVRNQPESYNMVTKNGTTRHEDFWQSEMILSTSREMPAPYNFLGFETTNPVVYIFRDTNMALKINHLSAIQNENEYIFLPGTTFSVINTIPFKDIESLMKKDIINLQVPSEDREEVTESNYIQTEPEKYGVLKMFLDAGYLDRWLVPNRMSLDDLVNYVTKTENGVKVVDDTKVREVKHKISGKLGISYDRKEGLVFYYCDVKNMDISVHNKIIKMENKYTKKTGRKSEVAFINKLYSSVTGIETVGGISKKGKKTRRRKKIKGKKTKGRKKTSGKKTSGKKTSGKKTKGGALRRGSNSRKGNRRKKTTRRHKKTNYELYKNLILNYKKA